MAFERLKLSLKGLYNREESGGQDYRQDSGYGKRPAQWFWFTSFTKSSISMLFGCVRFCGAKYFTHKCRKITTFDADELKACRQSTASENGRRDTRFSGR